MPAVYHIETYRSQKDKQFYFRVKENNGQVVSQGEGYVDRADRDDLIESLYPGLEVREVDE